MYKKIFQIFTFIIFAQRKSICETEMCQQQTMMFLYVNLLTFHEKFYIMVTSLTRFRRETTHCICSRLKLRSLECLYDYFSTPHLQSRNGCFCKCSNMLNVQTCMCHYSFIPVSDH